MRAIPGVEDAALTIQLPGTGEDYLSEFSIIGRAPGPENLRGFAGDIRDHGYAHDPRPTVYSCGFPGFYPDPAYLIKTKADPAHLIESVRRTVQSLEPNRAVYDAKPLAEKLQALLPKNASRPCSSPCLVRPRSHWRWSASKE
jgi:hypothetical protein